MEHDTLAPKGLQGAEVGEIAGRTVTLHYGDPAAEYEAAKSGAVIFDLSHEGRVRAKGRDRIDLLQRMSTNDLSKLAPGQARMTVLTNPLARMVDAVWVLSLPDEAILLTSPGRAFAVRRWLSGYVFFQDDVQLSDATEELGQLGIHGPRASGIAERLVPGAGALQNESVIQSDGVAVLRTRPLVGGGFTLLAPSGELPALWERAVAAGAVAAGASTFQTLRVEAGLPYGGHEITEDYIPLEAGLWPAVSFSKGCYIGQEIIARMESRGRLAKTLVGLKLSGPVEEGTEIHAGPMPVGRVTSTARSPAAGDIALAIVKTAHAEPGQVLDVAGVTGLVAGFPLR